MPTTLSSIENRSIHLAALVACAALVFAGGISNALTGERQGHFLRGSKAEFATSSAQRPPVPYRLGGPALRGSTYGLDAPITYLRGSNDDGTRPVTVDITGSVIRAPKHVLKDETLRPSDDRHGQLGVADRPVMRRSMAHVANLYDGLRLESGGIGDAVARSLRGSHLARASFESASATHARARAAAGAFLPKITGVLDKNGNSLVSENRVRAGGNVWHDVLEAKVEFSVPIFSSGALWHGYAEARALAIAADYTHLATEHQVALQAIAAHLNLRLNRSVESTLGENANAMEHIEHIARRRYQAGDASRTDIAIAEANVQGALAETDLARKTREDLEIDYESLTAGPVPVKLRAPEVAHLVPENVQVAMELARERNPQLASSWMEANASAHAARAERGRFGPQAELYGNYSHEITNSAVEEDRGWTVGARLTVPLVDFTALPTIAAAKHNALNAGYQAQDRHRSTMVQVRKSWTAYHSAKRRTGILSKQVKALSASVTGTRREYEAGFRSITDVLNDQVKLSRARISLAQTRHEKWLAAYEMAFVTAHPAVEDLIAQR